MKIAKTLFLLGFFLFLGSSKPLSLQGDALSPNSAIPNIKNEQTLTFERYVAHALKSGFINFILGVKEELTFVELEELGDKHVYFTIDEIIYKHDHIYVKAAYLVEEENGVIKPEVLELKISKAKAGSYTLFERIEEILMARTTFKKRITSNYGETKGMVTGTKKAFKTGLYQDGTKRVIFKGSKSGKTYQLIYKFGASSQTERTGFSLFKELHFNELEAYSNDPNRVWIKDIPSQKITQSYFDSLPLHKKVDLYMNIGRASIWLYLLGHDDFHTGNIILNHQFHVLDFESLGHAFFIKDEQRMELMQSLRHFDLELSWEEESVIKQGLVLGRETAAKEIVKKLPRILRLIDQLPANQFTYTRAIIRPTLSYDTTEPIPHFSIKITKENLKTIIIERALELDKQFKEEFDIDLGIAANFWSILGAVQKESPAETSI